MARKKNKTIIPDWFDLKNYEGSKNFTAKEWGLRLKIRYRILIQLENILSHGSDIAIGMIKHNFLNKMKDSVKHNKFVCD